MIPNELIGDLSNVHIYEPHIEAVKKQLSRDVNMYDKSNLSMLNVFHYLTDPSQEEISVNDIIKELKIDFFKLENYKSYPAIKANMLEPNI